MEFNEKLQELRKSRSLTQDQLAEALFVSRTAISKWESGRGYPSLDSLRQIARYFSVSIDELICTEEIIAAAQDEKKSHVGKMLALICGALDVLASLLLFLPIFRNGANGTSAPLFAIDVGQWQKALLAAVIGLTALNGLCGVIISRLDKPLWNRHRLATGMALSVIGTAAFMLARQPYAGILFLSALVVKGLLFRTED